MHKCVRCGSLHEDNDSSILKGCKCGSNFFLYMRTPKDADQIEAMKKELEAKHIDLEKELKKQIRKKKLKPKKKIRVKKVKPKKRVKKLGFGIETVRVPKEGIYEINIDALMKKMPLIILERRGVYFIYLSSVFEKFKKE